MIGRPTRFAKRTTWSKARKARPPPTTSELGNSVDKMLYLQDAMGCGEDEMGCWAQVGCTR